MSSQRTLPLKKRDHPDDEHDDEKEKEVEEGNESNNEEGNDGDDEQSGGGKPVQLSKFTVTGCPIPLSGRSRQSIGWVSNGPNHSLCSIGHYDVANTASGYLKDKEHSVCSYFLLIL